MNSNHTRLAFWTASSFIVISIGMIIYTFYADRDNTEREKVQKTEYTRFIRRSLFGIRILSMLLLLWAIMSVIVLRYRSRKGLLLINGILTVILYIVSVIFLIKGVNTLLSHIKNKQIAKEVGLHIGFFLIVNFVTLGHYVYFIHPGMKHINKK